MRALLAGALAALALTSPVLAEQQHPGAKQVLAIGGSVTEIVYALGQQERLIARDTTSTFPEEAQSLPDVGYMRALSPEGVLSVEPDLILSEEGSGPPETIDVLKEAGIPFEPIPSGTDPEGLTAKIEAVADALGVPDAADPVLAEMQADFEQLAAKTGNETQPKRVMFILSLEGGRVMAAGQKTEAEAMIRLAGAENAVQGVEGYKPLTDEAITAAAPDVVLMMDRGGDSGHGAGTEDLSAIPALATTPAVRNGAVIRMDGLYLLGFGPRAPRAALDLHHAIYGDG